MALPIKTFWFMSDCTERIQSQEDQRQFRVANNAQGGEHTQEFVESLAASVGNVFVVDKAAMVLQAPKDQGGFNELRMMANQKIG